MLLSSSLRDVRYETARVLGCTLINRSEQGERWLIVFIMALWMLPTNSSKGVKSRRIATPLRYYNSLASKMPLEKSFFLNFTWDGSSWSTPKIWIFLFEIQCTDSVSVQALQSIIDDYYRLSKSLRRWSLNFPRLFFGRKKYALEWKRSREILRTGSNQYRFEWIWMDNTRVGYNLFTLFVVGPINPVFS